MSSPRRGLNVAEKAAGAFLLCLAFFTLEVGAGSSYAFSGLVAAYVGAVMLAIRCVGGLRSVFGVVILWYASQHVLISQVTKAIVGQSPESRLSVPIPTILSETLLMLGFAAAGVVASGIRPNGNRVLFPPITDTAVLQRLAAASTMLAVCRILLITLVGGGVAGPMKQLGSIDTLAVASAVAIAVVQSKGKRLTNALAWTTFLPILFFSFVGGGRQGFVSVPIAIVLGGWAFGYRFRLWQYLSAIAFGLIFFFILSPYALVVRSVSRSDDLVRNINAAIDTFVSVVEEPSKYQFYTDEQLRSYEPIRYKSDYFAIRPGNASQLLNRYGLIKLNDMIVEDTLKSGTTGWAMIEPGLPKLLPSILSPNKIGFVASGTALAHRVEGVVGPSDYTTGITMGLTADAFGSFGYPGAFLLPFGLMLLLLVSYKVVIRFDMRRNVFGLAIVLFTAHSLSEQTALTYLSFAIYALPLTVLGYYVALRSANLFDLRYLRPRTLSDAVPDHMSGTSLK